MPETTAQRLYLPEYDLLRIAAAFAVVLLHVLAPIQSDIDLFGTRTWWAATLLNEPARAGVPLFLMLTGALLLPAPATKDFLPFYRQRLTRILLPFLVWDVVYYLAHRLHAGEPLFSNAFFNELFRQGSAYHLWYVYTLLGVYLFLPFLARLVEHCTNKQLFGLILLVTFPTTLRPLLNLITPFSLYLFDPLLEGYLGYVLLGCLLHRIRLSRATAWAIPLCAVGGWSLGVCFTWFRSSSEALDLTINGGYNLNHYLLAAAFFLAARYFSHFPLRVVGILRRLSALTYRAYLAHVLVLAVLERLIPLATPALRLALYPLMAFLCAMLVAYLIACVSGLLRRLRRTERSRHASL